MWKQIDKSEKKVLIISGLVSLGHLFLIAYAAIFLNIAVPNCLPNEKIFKKAELLSVGEGRYEVHFLAKMWDFAPKKLLLPLGSTVDFFLASKDITHGFHINHTNINLMAVPGAVNKATHTFSRPGIYQVTCHEYCGFGHENMIGQIEVSENIKQASMVPPLSEVEATSTQELSLIAAEGEKLYHDKGCVACHSLDGTTGIGPTFKGIFGTTEEMQDDSKIFVDDAYLTESIREPLLRIRKGFSPVMPKLVLSDDEIKKLIEFIKTVN